MYGERRGVYRDLVGKPEGKRPFGSPRRGWKYNNKMEVGVWTGPSWLRIGQMAGTCDWLRIGTGGGHV